MATMIPSLNGQVLSRMTSGEKRVARRLMSLLEDDYIIWYDIAVGKKRRYPDFIILHPSRGLLFLEVKDWKPETLQKINKNDVTLLTSNGLITKPHPLEQVRQCTYSVLSVLEGDSLLCQIDGAHKGNLIMPYGWGVIFTNITRMQMQRAIPDSGREQLLPDHLMIYKDEITEKAEAEEFQTMLWGMFNYNFGNTLTLPQIDRVRWHLFPEIRIDEGQVELFGSENSPEEPLDTMLPDIVKIMDVQQEQLARSLGDGHRVIHGVAGSGKTLILGYRCLYLARTMGKPILVLCFNITLAAKLRSFISSKGIDSQVQVYHFHDWCSQQIKTYHVDVIKSDQPYYVRSVETVIEAVDKGRIPKAQYGALLIDEGHDFEPEWLKLVVQMTDPKSESLLLLYDDAQSIYKGRTGLGFNLSSVGVQAKGRTTILKLNYRNTREILDFAYTFASHYFDPHGADDDQIPLIQPEAAGMSGPEPVIRDFSSLQEEVNYAIECLAKWHKHGIKWSDMAILCSTINVGNMIADQLEASGHPYIWLKDKQHKTAYDHNKDCLTVLTIHSSKGLEFTRVIMVGVGHLKDEEKMKQQNARLLYVGMTRAQDCLLITTSGRNEYSNRILGLDR
jgi:hypothetical protein